MIPADHIMIDGNTAWWVDHRPLRNNPALQAVLDQTVTAKALDRPCDGCDGRGTISQVVTVPHVVTIRDAIYCPDCDGTGRHTFTIEVACEACGDRHDIPIGNSSGGSTLRVHVVPDMVLKIVDNGHDLVRTYESGCVLEARHRDTKEAMHLYVKLGVGVETITLPPAAQPGMWAVKLEVHQ